MKIISVLTDFSEYPGLRHCSISDNSGELFYHQVLNEAFYNAITNGDQLTIDLDGVDGYAPSFIDEAFGNLVYDFTLNLIKDNVKIISQDEPHWVDFITNKTYPLWETRRQKGDEPKMTAAHEPWYRLVENQYEQKVWRQPIA